MKMEKFKQLRLKFEQRRSMRSQAAKVQSQEQQNEQSEANTTIVTESATQNSGGERGRYASMPVKRQSPNENDQSKASEQKAPVCEEPGNDEQKRDMTSKPGTVKVASMPVKRTTSGSEEKPQPAMKFKINKDKPAGMPVRRKPAAEEQTPTGLRFKASKDKVASMPVKRRDTTEKEKDDTSKRLSAGDSDLSDNKNTAIKPEIAKCVSMPLKSKTKSEKDSATVVKIKPSGHVSMPIKRKDTKEQERAQTAEGNLELKSNVTNDKSQQKNKISVTAPTTENKVKEKVPMKEEKSAELAPKAEVAKDKTDNKHEKDRKVQFLSVADRDDTEQENRQGELKSALKKGTPEDKTERKVDTLAVEGHNDVAKKRKSSLTEDKLQELEEAFIVFDQNRDGEITKEELGAVLYALGQRPTVTEVQALIRSVDLDKSGTIDFDEFVKIFSSKLTVDPEQELHEVFDIFDSNLDGFISDDELFAVLQKLGEQTSAAECKKMIMEADLNGDGKVDYREFKAILNSR